MTNSAMVFRNPAADGAPPCMPTGINSWHVLQETHPVPVVDWKQKCKDSGIIGYLKGCLIAIKWHDLPSGLSEKIDKALKHVEEMESR